MTNLNRSIIYRLFSTQYGNLHIFQSPLKQILCEINFGVSRSAKSDISTHLEILKFDFYEFWHFLKALIVQIEKFRAPRMAKQQFSYFSILNKLISRKIWMIEKSWNIHIVIKRSYTKKKSSNQCMYTIQCNLSSHFNNFPSNQLTVKIIDILKVLLFHVKSQCF